MNNTLYFGDNLDIIREYIKDETIDLIYLDPPFNSKANYNVIFKTPKKEDSPSQIQAFEDTWKWNSTTEFELHQLFGSEPKLAELMKGLELIIGKNDLLAYLVMMAIRLRELYRVLKDTGSLYLHCDPTASHYLKLILDSIFGMNNFLNEIAWCYKSGGVSKKWFSKKHDILLLYTKKRNQHTFNVQKIKSYGVPGGGQGGKVVYYKDKKGTYSIVSALDWWNISMLSTTHSERTGYPTQKPLTLLDRIIKASSNEGDLILDPFCGCGTAIVAAQRLNRNWIGMDITHLSIGLMEKRIYDEFKIKPKVIGNPASFVSAENLFKRNPLNFERWAVTRIDGMHPNKAQVGDKGIDGRGYIGPDHQYKTIISVKGGKHLTPSMVYELMGVVDKEKADFGVLITIHNPTDGMKKEAAKAGIVETPLGHHFPKIQIYTISDYFNGKKPELP